MTNDNLIFVFEKGTLRILNIGEINRFNTSAMREEIDEKIINYYDFEQWLKRFGI